MSEEQFRKHMRKVIAGCRSQKGAANALGVSPQYLGDVLHGRRKISGKFARAFGFKRVVSFKRIEA